MTKEEIKKLADKMLKNGLTAPDAAKTAVSTTAFPPSMAGGDGILKRRNS